VLAVPTDDVGPPRVTPEGRARRSRLDPETRRAQLVDTAVARLDEGGEAGVGVDDVADAAGVSRSLVYAYFGDRDGLAAEVYVRILGRLDRDLGLELPPDETALLHVVEGCMAFAQGNRAAWRLLVSDPARQHPVAQRARAERAARISAHWHRRRSDRPDRPDGVDPVDRIDRPLGELAGDQLLAEAALGMLESGVLHWLDHPEVPAGEAAVLLTHILWAGLRSRSPGAA
jgi:AcrR family transcriptional regulator